MRHPYRTPTLTVKPRSVLLLEVRAVLAEAYERLTRGRGDEPMLRHTVFVVGDEDRLVACGRVRVQSLADVSALSDEEQAKGPDCERCRKVWVQLQPSRIDAATSRSSG